MADWKKVLPEIEWIRDEKLREAVERVWDAAMKRGGWTDADLGAIPFTLLLPAGEFDLFSHTRIVTNLCRNIASVMKEMQRVDIDDDILYAGALLHDVGKLLEYGKEGGDVTVARSGKLLRHPLSGMGLAWKEDLPEEVCHIIAVHSREGDKSYRSPEALILHHADFIMFETFKTMKEHPRM
jgi:putative nucleotidyltransferase with HDIG domain